MGMAQLGAPRALQLLRRDDQLPGPPVVPTSCAKGMASDAPAAQSKGRDDPCPSERVGRTIPAPSSAHRPRLQTVGARTFDLRQEPGAGNPHAGICAGGGSQEPSLPRLDLAVRVAVALHLHVNKRAQAGCAIESGYASPRPSAVPVPA